MRLNWPTIWSSSWGTIKPTCLQTRRTDNNDIWLYILSEFPIFLVHLLLLFFFLKIGPIVRSRPPSHTIKFTNKQTNQYTFVISALFIKLKCFFLLLLLLFQSHQLWREKKKKEGKNVKAEKSRLTQFLCYMNTNKHTHIHTYTHTYTHKHNRQLTNIKITTDLIKRNNGPSKMH